MILTNVMRVKNMPPQQNQDYASSDTSIIPVLKGFQVRHIVVIWRLGN